MTTFPSHGGQRCSLTEPDWSATARPAGQTLVIHTRPLFIFDSFSLHPVFAAFLPTPPSIFPFFSPSLHLHILYLPLIICLTNPSILFSPSSVMKCASTAGGLTQYKLFPIKYCGRMTHYLWRNSFLPPKTAMMPWNSLWQRRLIYSRGWCSGGHSISPNKVACHEI